MDSIMSISQPQLLFKKPQLTTRPYPPIVHYPLSRSSRCASLTKSSRVVVATAREESERNPSHVVAKGGFADEMRMAAIRLHTRDQAKGGEQEPDGPPLSKWEPTIAGCLKFLVDSKLVYNTFETALAKSVFHEYAEFNNTGLERSERLAKDLEWFKEHGHGIPEVSSLGVNYTRYLEDISKIDPQAFMCHYYTVYFGHTAGGQMLGRKVTKMLNGKELEFYKWDGDLSQILQKVRDKLNRVSQEWSEDERNHCLAETEKPIKYYGDILRMITL